MALAVAFALRLFFVLSIALPFALDLARPSVKFLLVLACFVIAAAVVITAIVPPRVGLGSAKAGLEKTITPTITKARFICQLLVGSRGNHLRTDLFFRRMSARFG
ncbi:hypothetical protein ACH79_00775 [Bradyrhizobium sp. CCBAU 051011]|nr:hypothetical protein ACH79_00775 [Bradyrhizobium sp. CCBAU 051011]